MGFRFRHGSSARTSVSPSAKRCSSAKPFTPGARALFLGYFLFEASSNALLEKIGAEKTIMRVAMGWGTICSMQA